jgi:hypothetical protein
MLRNIEHIKRELPNVLFVVLYIAEAHASDGHYPLGYVTKEPTCMEERITAAEACVQDLYGKQKVPVSVLVDFFGKESLNKKHHLWPERLIIHDPNTLECKKTFLPVDGDGLITQIQNFTQIQNLHESPVQWMILRGELKPIERGAPRQASLEAYDATTRAHMTTLLCDASTNKASVGDIILTTSGEFVERMAWSPFVLVEAHSFTLQQSTAMDKFYFTSTQMVGVEDLPNSFKEVTVIILLF